VSAPEAGKPGQLLVLLNQGFGFASDFLSWNLDLDFPLGAAGGFRGAHNCLSTVAVLSLKREGEKRQTEKTVVGRSSLTVGQNGTAEGLRIT